MQELDLEDEFYSLLGSFIIVPKNTIIYRGYNTKYPILSNRPAYFGSMKTAQGYVINSRSYQLGKFVTKKQLKLIDIRYLMYLLSDIINNNKSKFTTISDKNMLMALMISFGITSFRHQMDIVRLVYDETIRKNNAHFKGLEDYFVKTRNTLIEEPGMRIAETNVDGMSITFIKELFKDIDCDGIISPRLFSAFHIEKGNTMSPEIILFDPINSVIQINYNNNSNVSVNTDIITINSLIIKTNYVYTIQSPKTFSYPFYIHKNNDKVKGGMIHLSSTYCHPLDEFNAKLDDNDIVAHKNYNIALKVAKKCKKNNIGIFAIEPPVPTIDKQNILLFLNAFSEKE